MPSIVTPAFYDRILILAFMLCCLFVVASDVRLLGRPQSGDHDRATFIQIGGDIARCTDATERTRAGDRCLA
jgi:hypothetical protein